MFIAARLAFWLWVALSLPKFHLKVMKKWRPNWLYIESSI